MTLRECYEQMGGDYEDTIRRLCTEPLMSRFLLKFLNDTGYATLVDAVNAKDGPATFAAAHTLKGITLNLGLTALYRPVNELTEAVRGGWVDEAVDLLPAITEAYEHTLQTIQTWQAEQ